MGGGVLAEYGLALLVEASGLRVLVDAGQSFVAVHNAQMLGIDLRSLDAVLLSHGHYDHTGGLRSVLRRATRGVPVYAHPAVWDQKYVSRGGETRFIGVPHRREQLLSDGLRLIETASPTWISDSMFVTGTVPRETTFEFLDSTLQVEQNGALIPDSFPDDQALVLVTDTGLVVVSGCAHSGMVNTMRYAQRIAGESRLRAWIGGTHLGPAPEEQALETVSALLEMELQVLSACHCTGPRATAMLADAFGERFRYMGAGTVLEV